MEALESRCGGDGGRVGLPLPLEFNKEWESGSCEFGGKVIPPRPCSESNSCASRLAAQ